MDSYTAHRALKATSLFLMLAAVAVPGLGFPQGSEPPSDRQRQLAEQIEAEQTLNGIHSPDLILPMTALGLFHQEQDEHALAAAALERARQIVRVNYGLKSLVEAPLLRQLARSEEARGDFDAAWYLEQELLSLAERHPGDLRVVPIFRELAASRQDTLNRYRAGESPPQIVLGCYYAKTPPYPGERVAPVYREFNDNCHSGSRRAVIHSLLTEVRTHQARAIEALFQNGRHSSDELRDLVGEVIRGSYENEDSSAGPAFDHVLAYASDPAVPLLSRTLTLMQLADLSVLNAHRSYRFRELDRVLQQYEQAYEQLVQVDRASIDETFSPELPLVLPSFLANPLHSEETPESTGHIDVAFNITRYGQSENARILDTTNAARAEQRELLRLIKRSVFRPRMIDGRIADTSPIVLRYYLNE